MSPRDAPVGIGVIGCGAIVSAVHLPVLARLPGARLVAVADPIAEARERARRMTGAAAVAEAESLLARPDVDAVVIAAPSAAHADLAVAAAGAGKHIYLEKPLATDADGGVRVAEAVVAAGVVAAVGFNRRLHPVFQHARALVRDGAVGSVLVARTTFGEPLAQMVDWRRRRATGGGALLELGSHHFDLLRWLLGDEIELADATLASRATEDDTAYVRLWTAAGTRVDGYFSFASARSDCVELVGERGVLRADRYASAVTLSVARGGSASLRHRREAPARSTAWRLRRLVRPEHEPSYRHALHAFVELLQGRDRSLPTVADGLRSLEAVLAAEAAARGSAPVKLPVLA